MSIKYSLLIPIILLYSCVNYKISIKETHSNIKHKSKYDRMDEAYKQEYQKTKDPATGLVPRHLLLEAQLYQQQQFKKLHKAALPNINWQERGPNNVGGRVRAILWDKNDKTNKTVFVAGVSGGLWKTTDVYATPIVWNKVNDFFDNLAITTIAQDPIRPDTMYFGTGEGFYNLDATQGNGIYKSTDGGATFSLLSSTFTSNLTSCTGTASCNFLFIQKLVVTSNGTLLAATRSIYTNRGGIFRSTDAGATFSKVFPTGTPNNEPGADIEIAANGNIFMAMGLNFSSAGSNGIYKSTNNGATFTRVLATSSSRERRIEIACAPNDSNYIYAITQNAFSNKAHRVYKSTDGGTSWFTIPVPVNSTSDTFTSNQAWYNLLLAVNPNDKNNVIIGGIDIYKTTNGGTSWSQITSWTGASSLPIVHSDQHIAVFKNNSNDTVLIGNDGGMFLTKNFSNTNPSFTSLNNGLNITQYYAASIHPSRYSNYVLGGTQDNGTHKFIDYGINSVTEVTGGDGGFCHIDHDNPNYQITAYTNSNFYLSTNGGLSFSTLLSDGNGPFINPTDYNSKSNILYAGYSSGSFLRISGITSSPSSTSISAGFTGVVSAVKVDTINANVVYFGTSSGKVYRVTNAHASPSVSDISTGLPSGNISCIEIDRKNSAHLLVTYSNFNVNSIWESTNSGSSWTSVEGDLPNMPVRWALFSPLGGDSALIATDVGVWSTNNLNGASTSWGASNSNLANVRVDMLKFRPNDSLIIAATHGRGIFTSDIFTSPKADFITNTQIEYIGKSITFTDGSYKATSWAWDFDNDGITDATSQNPTFAYATSGFKTIKLTINGSISITKSNYIQILPNMAVPYIVSNGGSFDDNSFDFHFGSKALSGNINLWERGAPSNALTTTNSSPIVWKTDLDADIIDATYTCALMTPNYNFSASGTYTIAFRKSMEVAFCNGPFSVQVQYSTDKGTSWNRLGVNGSGTNWYNRGPSTGCPIDANIFADRYGWTLNCNNENTSYDVSFLVGNANVSFRFVLSVSSGYGSSGYLVDGFMIDDFSISGPTNNVQDLDIETTIAENTKLLNSNATVDFYSASGKIIATLKNNSSHNYGNTKVEIDNSGIGTTNFSTNTLTSKRIFKKTIKITPTNANSSGNVDITIYFAKTEIDSWENTTAYSKSTLNLIKTPNSLLSTGNLTNTIYGNSPAVASFNTGQKVTANFTNGFSGLGSGANGNNGPLPVSWLIFEGVIENNIAKLKWKTASEINNSHFEIEKLNTDNQTFESIGTVLGNGNTVTISSYSFNDILSEHELNQTLIYRLKQVDLNGDFSYSNTISLYTNSKHQFVIYPNPGKDILNVIVPNQNELNVSLKIFNTIGMQVMEHQLLDQLNTIDTNQLLPGLYLIQIVSNNQIIETIEWIKQE